MIYIYHSYNILKRYVFLVAVIIAMYRLKNHVWSKFHTPQICQNLFVLLYFDLHVNECVFGSVIDGEGAFEEGRTRVFSSRCS